MAAEEIDYVLEKCVDFCWHFGTNQCPLPADPEREVGVCVVGSAKPDREKILQCGGISADRKKSIVESLDMDRARIMNLIGSRTAPAAIERGVTSR